MMIKDETVDADTITTYDEEVHEGLWLTIAKDENVTTDTETKDYDFGDLVSTQNDYETEKWNYGVLLETTSLTTIDGYHDAIDNTYSFLAYYDSISGMDFSRGFSYDAEHRLTSFDVEHNDERLVFLPSPAHYRITVDTYGITTAGALDEKVRQLEDIEKDLLPEGVESVAYPVIDTGIPVRR
jgi:hypothetical protein